MSDAKWNLIIDVDRCTNCCNCVLAAKDEHVGNDFPGYVAAQPKTGHRWVDIETIERGFAPVIDITHVPHMCNHCDDAPCVMAGKGAVSKRADGIVIIDPVKAKGRRDLVDTCPYHAIWWNEEAQLPQAWIFDAHLLDQGWKQPRCVKVCPTEAIQAVKIPDAEMQQQAAAEKLTVLKPELGTRPRVYYRNLGPAFSAFIAGTVEVQTDTDRYDCAEGVTVRIDGATGSFQTITDAFGDYRVDGLPPDGGSYTITAAASDGMTASATVAVHASLVVPPLRLS